MKPTVYRRRYNIKEKDIIKALLLERTAINNSNNCWLYTGKLHRTGYAYIRIGNNKSLSIHRLSMWIYNDFNLDDTITKILHKQNCPNKHCWNPEHLYVGTQKQNIHDSIELGNHYVFGEKI